MRRAGRLRVFCARRAVETLSTHQTIYPNGKGSPPTFDGAGRVASLRPAFETDYSTALSRARQHLFFDREHHARLQKGARRVVNSARNERAALVEHKDVRAFFKIFRRVERANSRAVPRPSRLLGG